MTALPRPGQLLTIADYEALPEDSHYRWELVEGNLTVTPSPIPRHNLVIADLYGVLNNQLPDDLVVVPDVDLDLELAPRRQPGTARRPDLVVVTRSEYERVGAEGGILRAGAAVLVVEVISPGSRRTDTITKRRDYADAGVAQYWIVDLDGPVSLTAGHLSATGYQDAGPVTGLFEIAAPFPVRIDLDTLG